MTRFAKKPRAVPKPKAKAPATRSPASKMMKRRKSRQQRRKPSRRTARNRNPKPSMSKNGFALLEGQNAAAVKNKCVNPCTNVLDAGVDNVYNRVLLAIDEFIFRAMLSKPSNFVLKGPDGRPTIGFQVLRGYWLYCFQYYMYKCDCLKSNYIDATSYGNFKIPFGLAKIFQQFAPFTDAATGSQLQYQFPVLNKTITANYMSVDANTTDPDSLGCPYARYLIHCGDKTSAGVQLVEYATLGNKSILDYDGYSVPFREYVAGISSTTQQAIQNLFSGTISVDRIPRHAPDGSAYVFYTRTAVISAVPNFRADMGVICGRGYQETPFDLNNNLIYDSPIPTVRVYNGGYETGPESPGYSQTVRAVYAYVTSGSARWNVGSAITLVSSTKCFTDITDFSYRSKVVDVTAFARRLVNAYRPGVWDAVTVNNTAQNLTWMFCMSAWNSLITRIFASSSVYCTGDADQNPAFWYDSLRGESTKFAPTVADIISSVGPVKVSGKIVFPYFGTVETFNCATNSTNVGWTKVISTTGAWTVSSSVYGFGDSVQSAGTINITYPGTTNPVTRTDPPGVVYNTIMSTLGANFINSYQNAYPETYAIDSCSTIADEPCGRVPAMLTNLARGIQNSTNVTWKNSLITVYGSDTTGAVYYDYCASTDMTSEVLANNILLNPETATTSIRPLRVIPGAVIQDVTTTLQNNINSSTNSQFRQMEKGSIAAKAAQTGSSHKDAAFAMNRSLIRREANNSLDPLIAQGTGDRSGLVESMYELAQSAAVSAGKEAMKLVINSIGGQNVTGSGQEYFSQYIPILLDSRMDWTRKVQTVAVTALKKAQPSLIKAAAAAA